MTYFGQAHRGLSVGFILFLYSVVCTLESLSLFYLAFNLDLYVQDDTSIS